MKNSLIKFWNEIPNLPIIKQLIGWSKKYSFPGFSNVPIYNIIVFIYKEIIRDNITTRANSVAFSFFLGLFPFIIFLFSLLPILPFTANYVELLQQYLSSAMPIDAYTYLMGIIEGVIGIKREGLLSLGFILALFFSSNGMLSLMAGFEKSFQETYKMRGYFHKRLVAIGLISLLTVLFIISFVLLIIGNFIISYIDEKIGLTNGSILIITIVKYIVAFFLLYVGITIIYRYGTSFRKRIKFINPGSILATFLSIMTSLGFSYFVNNFGRYNELYGSIGALIVIMLWLQFNAFVLLIGYELNASIAVNRDLLANREDDDGTL